MCYNNSITIITNICMAKGNNRQQKNKKKPKKEKAK